MSKKISLEEATIQSLYNQLDDSEKKKGVDGIVDDILIVTDPEISSEEYDELIDRANELVDETEEGDIPQLEDYLGMYAQMCPICGSTFIEDHILEPGTACPICLDTPQAFVMVGQLQDEDEVAEREGVQQEPSEDEDGYGGATDEPMEEAEPDEQQEELVASEEVKESDNKLEEDVKIEEENKVEEVVTSKTVNGWSDDIKKQCSGFFADVKEADKEIMSGNKGEFTQAKTEDELADYFDIVSRSALEISNSLKENLEKKQEYLEYNNTNPFDKDTFTSIDELQKYITEMGYELMNDGISEEDTQIEVFDPRESDGNVYVFEMDVTADDVRLHFSPKESYNMNENKEIKTEVEKKINTKVLKLDDNVEIEIEVDETPGFEKEIKHIWYTDWDGSVGFDYDKSKDEFVGFDNPNGSFLTPIEDEQIKDEIHKILNESKVTESNEDEISNMLYQDDKTLRQIALDSISQKTGLKWTVLGVESNGLVKVRYTGNKDSWNKYVDMYAPYETMTDGIKKESKQANGYASKLLK